MPDAVLEIGHAPRQRVDDLAALVHGLDQQRHQQIVAHGEERALCRIFAGVEGRRADRLGENGLDGLGRDADALAGREAPVLGPRGVGVLVEDAAEVRETRERAVDDADFGDQAFVGNGFLECQFYYVSRVFYLLESIAAFNSSTVPFNSSTVHVNAPTVHVNSLTASINSGTSLSYRTIM